MPRNFEFVKLRNQQLYQTLLCGEKELKIDYLSAARYLREAFEGFINSICNKYTEINDTINRQSVSVNLSDKIKLLTNKDKLSEISSSFGGLKIKNVSDEDLYGYKRGGRAFNRLFESDGKKREARRRITHEADFIRIVCNDYTHSDVSDHVFKRTYETALDAYRYFHRILRRYYCTSNGINDFSEDLIPLGKYNVEKSVILCLHRRKLFLLPNVSPTKMAASPKTPDPILYHRHDRSTRKYDRRTCLFTIRIRAEMPGNPCK